MSGIKEAIRSRYGEAARTRIGVQNPAAAAVARAFGYTEEELAAIPDGANMGLSCGNPTAMASLKPGETVLDLGSGGGLDVFLAAKAVGPTGRAIGVDMTEDMVALARANAKKGGVTNAEFHLAAIEDMPLADGSVDCVISNCVLNLVEDKTRAFAEIFRVLKPGGRLAVSDIALKAPLPEALVKQAEAWVGCIAGAITIGENEAKLRAAGFRDVAVIDAGADLNAYKAMGEGGGCCPPAPGSSSKPAPNSAAGCCGPAQASVHEGLAGLIAEYDLNQFAASVKIFALKH